MSAPTQPEQQQEEQPERTPEPTSVGLMQPGAWRLERRLYTTPWHEFWGVVAAILAALIFAAGLVTVAGAGVTESLAACGGSRLPRWGLEHRR